MGSFVPESRERNEHRMAEKYFDYMGMLRLNDNRLLMQELIAYVSGSRLSQEEKLDAVGDIMQLRTVGLVSVSQDPNQSDQTVTLTAMGIAFADFVAHIRSATMLKQSPQLSC